MPSSSNDSEAQTDRDEFMKRVYSQYPRISRVLSSFRQNPLSGNALRMLFTGEDGVESDERQVYALETPVMWEANAPIVIAQYGNYASDRLPQFWNATLPDIQDRYGDIARYEHHDVPVFSNTKTEYKLATLGRAIQHYAGNEAFWLWFDHVMISGVQSVTDGYDLVEKLEIDVDRNDLEDAVKYDAYNNVIWNDIESLLRKGSGQSEAQIQKQLEEQDAIFTVFVNGIQVEPSYGSIVGVIEKIRSGYSKQNNDEVQEPDER